MKNLSLDEFNRLTENSMVLTEDGYGKKVLLLKDKSVLKLFRVKRKISSAVFFSPARRFAANAKKLARLSIPTVNVIAVYNISSIKRTAVHYHQLQGQTVRQFLQQQLQQKHSIDTDFLKKLGSFLAWLHQQGVYFRSAHFGNIIYTPEQSFGLIDIADMKISRFALVQNKRLRNLKHIFRLAEDIRLINQTDVIEQSYLQHCGIKNKSFHNKLIHTVNKLKLMDTSAK